MRTSLPASDLLAASLVWLLEIDLAGQVYRFSSRPIELTNDDGDPVSYPGGLNSDDIDYSETLDRFSTQATEQTVSLEVVFPVDMAQARRRGRLLSSAVGELSMVTVREGAPLQTWEARHVVLRGSISQPEIGHPRKPSGWAAFSIEPGAQEDMGRLVLPSMRISAVTALASWTTTHELAERNLGKPYVLPVGRPGVYRPGGIYGATVEGSPAYCVDYDSVGIPNGCAVLHIAGCHTTVPTVFIRAEGETRTHAFVPSNTYDRQGQPIAIVDTSGAGISADWRNAAEYWVSWGTSLAESGSGARNPYRDADLIGAGDVLRWVLSRSSLAIDHGAWASVAPLLNGLAQVSTYINDPDASPWAFAETVLEMLPVSVRRGPGGLYPIVHDIGHQTSGELVALEQGRELTRTSALREETRPDDLASTVSVEYAPRATESDSYLRTITVGRATSGDSGTSATVQTRAGEVAYPGTAIKTASAPMVYDAATAASWARRLAREAALMAWSVSYRAPPSLGWIDVGRLISLTDSELYLASQPAEVIGKAWDGGGWVYTLYIIEDPARDDRS